MTLDDIKDMAVAFHPVGSRVTCDPAPPNTDVDYLVLVRPGEMQDAEHTLFMDGYEIGGSVILPSGESVPCSFRSFRKGNINLILTEDLIFLGRFLAATSVCKRLNVLSKPDRIMIFQAVLYGNY